FPRDLWLEVKPDSYESADLQKPSLLAVRGIPVAFLHEIAVPQQMHDACTHHILYGDSWDVSYGFCMCSNCRAIGFEFEGRSERILCGCRVEEEHTDATEELRW